MPILKAESPREDLHYIIWKIDESTDDLRSQIILHPSDSKKLNTLRHPEKIREFLALRCCLKAFFGENPEVLYHENGKPYLKNNFHISFSHCDGYAAAIFSPVLEVGIDLEVHRETIRRIAPKFLREEEFQSITPRTEIGQILNYWGAKEVIVKIEGNRRLNFIKQIKISPFTYQEVQSTRGCLELPDKTKLYQLHFAKIRTLYLAYGWEIERN